ncbi:Rieske (2Fe-2S) protein [Pseudomonas turukhanskensis]|uniref:(2Fe-2S)-binding protein n=1 Tax=Pseudomonas turukhanskensis TaxID=1806536 RepID=A0A9W6NI79_9PSED|nr:Rieske (2Fe-2S) protein [Pseudomonas turukhanskensis]GLK91873.1 (2Fe-2S)-binding protein [Pseudomonas turukhanskensis]
MQFLCAPDSLAEGQSRGFLLGGINLLAVRKNGQVHAYLNRCPHKGVPLEWQADEFLDSSKTLIQCARHGALFLIESGECVTGPCEGDSLSALSCHEDATGIWITLPR